MDTRNTILGALVAVMTMGCYSGGEPVNDAELRVHHSNRLSFNGAFFNCGYCLGLPLSRNGLTFNGLSFNDPDIGGPIGGIIDELTRNGTTLEDAAVVDGGFTADENGQPIAGVDFIGAEMTIRVLADDPNQDDVMIQARINDIQLSPTNDGVLYHSISYFNVEANAWVPVCEDENGDAVEAVILNGAWDGTTGDRHDLDAFTIGCRHGSLGKCVDLDYVPWQSAKDTSLVDHHQACTRMVRADFCGDGTPHTLDGTWIDVYDAVGLNKKATKWEEEAEWGPDGATCMTENNRSLLTDTDPACAEALEEVTDKCGKLKKKDGGLVATRFDLDFNLGDDDD